MGGGKECWLGAAGCDRLRRMERSNGGEEPARTDGEQDDDGRMDLISRGVWHAPRGPKTRAAAWVILAAMALCIVTTLALLAMQLFS